MTDWIVRGRANLLAASRSADLSRARLEWRFTRTFEDLGAAVGRCELCEHPKIRHRFEIENQTTSRHLWVGSECIKKFVPIFVAGVEVTDETQRDAIVDRIVKDARTADRRARAFSLLERLAQHDHRLRDPHWRENWALGYSVKQLQLIAVVARGAGLPFNAADFRINTRRGRVMEQLYALQDWQYRQLRAALTPVRRREADAHFGLIVRSPAS